MKRFIQISIVVIISSILLAISFFSEDYSYKPNDNRMLFTIGHIKNSLIKEYIADKYPVKTDGLENNEIDIIGDDGENSQEDNQEILNELKNASDSYLKMDYSYMEDNEGFIHLEDVYDSDVTFDIPFDIVYANIDLYEITDWEKIFLYERCHFDGKVYEFFNSDKLPEGHDFSREGLLIITDEVDKDKYQIIELDRSLGADFVDKIFYFEDVTYDGENEILINWGGFGAQLCHYMSCYKYDHKSDMYIEIPSFQYISNPQIDKKEEYIFGSHRGGAAIHYYYAYQYINDEFACLYAVETEYCGGEYILSVNDDEPVRTYEFDNIEQFDNPVLNLFFSEDEDSRFVYFY